MRRFARRLTYLLRGSRNRTAKPRRCARDETRLPSTLRTLAAIAKETSPRIALAACTARSALATGIAPIDELIQQAVKFARPTTASCSTPVRRQFVIGYNVTECAYRCELLRPARRRRGSANFIAIAQGSAAGKLVRARAPATSAQGGEPVLLSWSGSMFEYLMPLLIMPTYENTLLDQTYLAAVERQIDYGRQRGVRGGVRNADTTPSMRTTITSIARSACRGSG